MKDGVVIQFEPVPPPEKAPSFDESARLGLLPCLKVAKARNSYRCSSCNTYQVNPEWVVWVPDAVSKRDSADVVEEICRRNAYNGHRSGWCIECARKLGAARKFASDDPLEIVFFCSWHWQSLASGCRHYWRLLPYSADDHRQKAK